METPTPDAPPTDPAEPQPSPGQPVPPEPAEPGDPEAAEQYLARDTLISRVAETTQGTADNPLTRGTIEKVVDATLRELHITLP